MTKVISELAVATATYTDKSSGQQKSRYENVGVLMKDGNDRLFILLNRHFNPAGVPSKPGGDKIIISCFEPKKPDATQGHSDEVPY